MEKILRIEEASFKTKENDRQTFVGYQIITDQQTIKVGISEFHSEIKANKIAIVFGCIAVQ